jgi:hypothetical protein
VIAVTGRSESSKGCKVTTRASHSNDRIGGAELVCKPEMERC